MLRWKYFFAKLYSLLLVNQMSNSEFQKRSLRSLPFNYCCGSHNFNSHLLLFCCKLCFPGSLIAPLTLQLDRRLSRESKF